MHLVVEVQNGGFADSSSGTHDNMTVIEQYDCNACMSRQSEQVYMSVIKHVCVFAMPTSLQLPA